MKIIAYDNYKELPYHSTLLKIAKLSKCHIRVSAVLVKGGRIISYGVNSHKSSPIIQKYKKFRLGFDGLPLKKVGTHAEFDCLNNVDEEDLSSSTIIILRLRRDGSVAPSYPCEMCATFIKKNGVKKVKCIGG